MDFMLTGRVLSLIIHLLSSGIHSSAESIDQDWSPPQPFAWRLDCGDANLATARRWSASVWSNQTLPFRLYPRRLKSQTESRLFLRSDPLGPVFWQPTSWGPQQDNSVLTCRLQSKLGRAWIVTVICLFKLFDTISLNAPSCGGTIPQVMFDPDRALLLVGLQAFMVS